MIPFPPLAAARRIVNGSGGDVVTDASRVAASPFFGLSSMSETFRFLCNGSSALSLTQSASHFGSQNEQQIQEPFPSETKS